MCRGTCRALSALKFGAGTREALPFSVASVPAVIGTQPGSLQRLQLPSGRTVARVCLFLISKEEPVRQRKNFVPEDVTSEERQKVEEQRQKLVMQRVKLPNGATFTILKPVQGPLGSNN